jgi:hypothetical protein
MTQFTFMKKTFPPQLALFLPFEDALSVTNFIKNKKKLEKNSIDKCASVHARLHSSSSVFLCFLLLFISTRLGFSANFLQFVYFNSFQCLKFNLFQFLKSAKSAWNNLNVHTFVYISSSNHFESQTNAKCLRWTL